MLKNKKQNQIKQSKLIIKKKELERRKISKRVCVCVLREYYVFV